MDFNMLYNSAIDFEKRAQAVVSAQPGDVETALERAKLWQLSSTVSPLLDSAGVPDSASVNISIVVSKGPVVSFNAVLAPPSPKVSAKLNALLQQKFSTIMTNTLKAAKLDVADKILVKWLTF